MNILLVTDAYLPMRTSAATLMHDLAQAFIKEGHQVTLIIPSSKQFTHVERISLAGVTVLNVKAFKTKDTNHVHRLIGEFVNPFLIWRYLNQNKKFSEEDFDVIIWYSPTIFWGPFIARAKKKFNAKSYLILRDIFPDWAFDLGLIKNRIIYWLLKRIAYFQYLQADVIGVQSPNNLEYFIAQNPDFKLKTEVLWNWLAPIEERDCSIDLTKTHLSNRRIFVYAGNMGIAQAVESLIDLATIMSVEESVGFIFVGRGSEVNRLKRLAKDRGLKNILFFDEIEYSEIPGLYRQCVAGMIALDKRHSTHNIPGKFLTYIKYSLPVFVIGNGNNDLESLIKEYGLGIFCTEINANVVADVLDKLGGPQSNDFHDGRFIHAMESFNPLQKARQILSSLSTRL